MKFINQITSSCNRLPHVLLATLLASYATFTDAQYCPPISASPAPNPNVLLQSSFENTGVESNREWIDPATCTERLPVSMTGTTTLVNTPSACDYYVVVASRVSGDLIIEPGVTIIFGTSGSLTVEANGNLTARGTSEQRIQLLGEFDKRGFWSGVTINDQGEAILENVDIRNAGDVCGSAFCPSGGLITMIGSALTMTDSTIAGAGDTVNGMVLGADVDLKSFERNRFCDNTAGLLVSPTQIPNLSASNDYSYANNPNDIPYVVVGKGFDLRGFRWPKLNTPYFVDNIEFDKGIVSFEPGTEVVLNVEIEVESPGQINSIGTPSAPIIFRGANAQPSSWYAIDLQSNRQENRFKHTIFDGGFHAINLFASSVSLDDVTIRNTKEEGIDCNSTSNYIYERNVTFENIGGGNYDNYEDDCIVRPLTN